MRNFPLHTPEQLTAVLRDLRQRQGLTQAQAAAALGITQQSYSALEAHAGRMSVHRLLRLLALLGGTLTVTVAGTGRAEAGATSATPPEEPSW